jgi:hypothetical protein
MAEASRGKKRKVSGTKVSGTKVSGSGRSAPQPLNPAVFITVASKVGKIRCSIDTTKDNLVEEKRVCVCCTVPGETPQEAEQSVGQGHHILCIKCYNRIYKNYQRVMEVLNDPRLKDVMDISGPSAEKVITVLKTSRKVDVIDTLLAMH